VSAADTWDAVTVRVSTTVPKVDVLPTWSV
jgi:hypothetical protein